MWQIISILSYNFAHDATAELSRHVQNYGIIWTLLFKLKQDIFLRDLDYELIIVLWNGSRPSIVFGILAPPWPRHNIRTPQVDRHACASLMPVAHHWSARCWTPGYCDAGNSGNWLVFFGTDFEKTSSMVTLGFTQIAYISWKDFFKHPEHVTEKCPNLLLSMRICGQYYVCRCFSTTRTQDIDW